MFITDCQACGLRELRGVRSIELLVNTGSGPAAVYRCRVCETVNTLGGTAAAPDRVSGTRHRVAA